MHAFAVLSLVASTALVAAQQEEYASFSPLSTFGTLQARQQQSCASVGGKACGSKCIQITYTCCGNGAGACEVGYTCGIAANGIYGCCPIGKRCRGDAPEPSTTIIGGSRPTSTTVRGGGDDDDDEPTSAAPTTPSTSSTTRRLTPATTSSTAVRTTPVGDDDRSSSSSSSGAVPTSGSGNTGGGSSGNGGNGNSNGNSNGGSGSGSTTTAANGGGGGSASSARMVTVGLASLAGGFIAAVAALL